jgi:hypothetical protein
MERRYRYALAIGLFALFNCRSEETAVPLATETTTPSAAVATTPTNVTVRFEGLICHVIDSGVSGVPARAAVLRGRPGTEAEHNLSVILPPVTEASRPLVDSIGNVEVLADGRLSVTGIHGVSLRIDGAAPPLVRSEEWRRYVPSLREASGNPNRFPHTALHSELRASAPPSSNGPFVLFFEYGGGRLSATPHEDTGRFDRPGAAEREFARSTALSASTRRRPRLIVTRRNNQTEAAIEFLQAGDLLIEVLNRAKHERHAHFHIYSDVSDGKVPIPPVRQMGKRPADTGVTSAETVLGTVVGCADSTYP